jgi:cold shock CspA family protein/ribosome-associated translation inhibitor RaiA
VIAGTKVASKQNTTGGKASMEFHWVHAGDLSDQEREAAEARVLALSKGHTDLIDVRITARASSHHKHGDKEIRITCEARGKEIVATRSRPDAGQALNEVLDAFEREVRRLRERRIDRRNERPVDPPYLGIVSRIFPDKGYGFVLTDGGEQVYFHRNAVRGGLEFDGLAEGDRVSLNLEAGDEGPQATAVLAAPPDAPGP